MKKINKKVVLIIIVIVLVLSLGIYAIYNLTTKEEEITPVTSLPQTTVNVIDTAAVQLKKINSLSASNSYQEINSIGYDESFEPIKNIYISNTGNVYLIANENYSDYTNNTVYASITAKYTETGLVDQDGKSIDGLKVLDNVVYGYYSHVGNGSEYILFAIKTDGTVSTVSINNDGIAQVTNNYNNLKDIVRIFNAAAIGADQVVFVDVNGVQY